MRKLNRVTFIEAQMIEIRPIDKFKVCLTVNLEEYCRAWKVYKEAESAATEEAREKESLTAYKKIREELIAKLRGIAGELHWYEIRKIFASQCKLADVKEKQLHDFLKLMSPGLAEVPLAIEVFNTHFVEFLKNSIDAILLRYLKDDETTALEMTIELNLDGDKIRLLVRDNGGGFADKDLGDFEESLKTVEGKRMHSKKKEHSFYCLGASGLGMRNAIAHFIHGCMVQGCSALEPIYDIPKGATVMRLSNHAGTHGAQLEFISPLYPFPRFEPPTAAPLPSKGGVAAVGITPSVILEPPGAILIPGLRLPPRLASEIEDTGPATSRGSEDSDDDEVMETGGGLVRAFSCKVGGADHTVLGGRGSILGFLRRTQSAAPTVGVGTEPASRKRRIPDGGHTIDEEANAPPDGTQRNVRARGSL